MKKPVYFIWLFVVILCSCKKDKEKPKYEGEAILSSELFDIGGYYNGIGFSFEKGENVSYPFNSSTVPDIVVTNQTDAQNNITGAVLNSPNNLEAFYLNQSFNTASEAKAFYDGYNEVTVTDFEPLGQPVELHQVWTIQTSAGKYAKLLVRKIEIITAQDYVEITVSYKYQPDGSGFFDDD